MEAEGVYCSSANRQFTNRDELSAHYQSEYHRYNLKRKIAGLPPVTHEWFEARKAQLTASNAAAVQRVWFDPLTKKKFFSENTYLAATRSKKYQELLKKSGKPAPAAIVTTRKLDEAQPAAAPQPTATAPQGFTVKPVIKQHPESTTTAAMDDNDEDNDAGSAWETASEEEMDGSEQWEEWDVCKSLFDNHISPTFEANLEYMWKNFGFYLPDAEHLSDPAGLLKYLGAKLAYGHVPLYESGDNPNAKQFPSLHGVQRHMVDTGRCKLFYDDNEDEYADFYQYTDSEDEMEVDGKTGALILGNGQDVATTTGGYELAVTSNSGRGGVKLIGSREFARYYKQRHRLGDGRSSAFAAKVVAEYKRLSVPLLTAAGEERAEKKKIQKQVQRHEKLKIANALRRNVNDNLPRNVPY